MIDQIFKANNYPGFLGKSVSASISSNQNLPGKSNPGGNTYLIDQSNTSPYSQLLKTNAPRLLEIPSGNRSIQAADTFASAVENEFSNSIKSILTPDAQGNIHEEELQYALAVYLLNKISPEGAALYSEVVAAVIGQGEPPLSAEDAGNIALREVVTAGLLSIEEAETINGVSFVAAQFDQDRSKLYDNRGSKNDPTIAIMAFDDAITQANSVLSALETSATPLPTRPLDVR